MRSLSLHYGTIEIASVAGESRRIGVSGLAKARLLWLFRNFSILEFPVLSKTQKQLIYQVWNSGMRIPAKEAPRDVIGIVEAFCPQPNSKESSAEPASAKQEPANESTSKAASNERGPQYCSVQSGPVKPGSERPGQPRTPARPGPPARLLLASRGGERPRVRFTLRAGLRSAATWRAFSVLLLGAAMYLGPRYLPPKHPHTPKTQIAAVPEEKKRIRSEPSHSDATPAAQSSAERISVQPAALPQQTNYARSGDLAPVAPLPVAATEPAVGVLGRNVAPAAAAADLPEAMAHDASWAQMAVVKLQSAGPQEVLIRVRVDTAGQAQSFHVLRGGEKTVPEALKAARLWNFKPCAGSEACEQVLKFTDYGDSSRVQRIE